MSRTLRADLRRVCIDDSAAPLMRRSVGVSPYLSITIHSIAHVFLVNLKIPGQFSQTASALLC